MKITSVDICCNRWLMHTQHSGNNSSEWNFKITYHHWSFTVSKSGAIVCAHLIRIYKKTFSITKILPNHLRRKGHTLYSRGACYRNLSVSVRFLHSVLLLMVFRFIMIKVQHRNSYLGQFSNRGYNNAPNIWSLTNRSVKDYWKQQNMLIK